MQTAIGILSTKRQANLKKSTYKAAPVSAVEADGICTLTVVNPDGTTTVVKLPTTAASITENRILLVIQMQMVISMHSLLLVKNMADNKIYYVILSFLCNTGLLLEVDRC